MRVKAEREVRANEVQSWRMGCATAAFVALYSDFIALLVVQM